MSRFTKRVYLLLSQVRQGKLSKAEAARRLSVSRKTVYQWLDKLPEMTETLAEGKEDLALSGTSDQLEKKIVNIAAACPDYGPRKIAALLKKEGLGISERGVWLVLQRNELNTRELRQQFAQDFRTPTQTQSEIPGIRRLIPETRKRMVEELLSGRKWNEVASDYGVSRKTLAKWRKRYLAAREEEAVLLEAMTDQHPLGAEHPKGADEETRLAVLSLVRENPALSSHRIAERLSGVGNHGVQGILERAGLNTKAKRQAWAATEPELVAGVRPSVSWLSRLVMVWQEFLPTRAPAPPPARSLSSSPTLAASPSAPRIPIFNSFRVPFVLSLVSTVILSNWMLLLISSSSVWSGIGMFLASIALFAGFIFFLYSMKYYLTVAVVLSFSRRTAREGAGENGGGGGFEGLLTGFFKTGGETEVEGEASGKANLSGLSWLGVLGAVFGIQVEPVAHDEARTGGLESQLDEVTLERKPFISVQIPFYNEKHVAERIIRACQAFDYYDDATGEARFEVLVLDDSTDETTEICERLAKDDPKVKVLHRPSREGFKGGALKYAHTRMHAETEFIVIFDADFVPYPDTLEHFLKYLKGANGGSEDYSQTNIAAVQGYQWHVLNKSENWITRGVRSEFAGSYVMERSGEEVYGGLKQIAGSVYMLHVPALEAVGGWGTSITEDFQLTLKLYEQGYKVLYTPYIQTPSECVSTFKRLVRQRMRWAEGHSNNIRKMFWRLMFGRWERVRTKPEIPNALRSSQAVEATWKWVPSPLTWKEKFEVLYLSPYYLQAFFFLVGTSCWIVSEVVFKSSLPFWTVVWGWSLVLTNLFALPLMNAVGLFLEEAEERDYAGLLSFVLLSYLLVPFQAYAAVKGFVNEDEGTWFRTPKSGKITDAFKRGNFYRFISGILPWSGRGSLGAAMEKGWGSVPALAGAGVYGQRSSAFEPFGAARTVRAPSRWYGNLALGGLVVFTAVMVGWQRIEEKVGEAAQQPEVVAALGVSPRLVAEKDHFRVSERPTFRLHLDSIQPQPQGLIQQAYAGVEDEVVPEVYYRNQAVEAPVTVRREGAEYVLEVGSMKENFKPGVYTLKVRAYENGELVEDEVKFDWGVLAINTVQSAYLPGEEIQFGFGVVDDVGRTICDAELNLAIWVPSEGQEYSLSTQAGTIQQSGECSRQSVTNTPDYVASFTAGEMAEEYELHLVARAYNGVHEIDDVVRIVESLPMRVERYDFPTRIFPKAEYPVRMRVTPAGDFAGTVVERLPDDFLVYQVSDDGVLAVEAGEAAAITWEVEWQAGETYELGYTIVFPLRSPDFYELGPLVFETSEGVVWQDYRPWQVAADAIAFVQSTSNNASGTSVNVVFGSNNTAGNLIVVAAYNITTSVSVTGITDTQGNTYQAATSKGTASGMAVQIYYAENISGGANTVTVNYSGSSGVLAAIHEYSGLATSNVFDQSNSNTGTGTTQDSGSVSTYAANELIFGAVGYSSNAVSSPGSTFTSRESLTRFRTEDKTVSSTGSYSADFSTTASVNWVAQVATFSDTAIPEVWWLLLLFSLPLWWWLRRRSIKSTGNTKGTC